MLCKAWGAVGVVGWWVCDVNVPCTCTHGPCVTTHGARHGWWRRAKNSIPPSLHTPLGHGEVNPKIFQCVQRYAWRWEHTGTDLMAETGRQVHKMSFGA